jgi:hypothetical protein
MQINAKHNICMHKIYIKNSRKQYLLLFHFELWLGQNTCVQSKDSKHKHTCRQNCFLLSFLKIVYFHKISLSEKDYSENNIELQTEHSQFKHKHLTTLKYLLSSCHTMCNDPLFLLLSQQFLKCNMFQNCPLLSGVCSAQFHMSTEKSTIGKNASSSEFPKNIHQVISLKSYLLDSPICFICLNN